MDVLDQIITETGIGRESRTCGPPRPIHENGAKRKYPNVALWPKAGNPRIVEKTLPRARSQTYWV